MSKIPYEDALGDRDPLKVLQKTHRKLVRLLDDLTDEQIEEAPAPGKWNLRELISHMADCEIAWAWRLRYVYGEKDPVIQPFDQDSWAKMYKAYSLSEALGCFKALRVWNIAFIDNLKDSDTKKVVVHPERGEETLWTIVRIMAGHDLHHLALLDKLPQTEKKSKKEKSSGKK